VYEIFDLDGANFATGLTLEYHVAVVGMEEKHEFTISNESDMQKELIQIIDEWKLSKESFDLAAPIIKKVGGLESIISNLG
jgi:hypothetical protein